MADNDEISIEEKTENLMNIVVESRKRFGKMCIDYDQKCHLMENKMLNMQIETISNYHFKSKNIMPDINYENINKDSEEFKYDVLETQKRRENLKKQLKNVKNLVEQLKRDNLTRKAKEPFTAEAMLLRARNK